MTFLNAALLAGTAAFVVPLVIHLLNRSRFQVVPWAAMHLLDFSLPQNTRRWQWQSLLLLLVRCLIPILLALCMARPVLTLWRALRVPGNTGIALVLDDSYSMQAPPTVAGVAATDTLVPRAASSLEHAAREAQSIADHAAAGSQFVLLATATAREPHADHAALIKMSQVGRDQLQQRLSQIDYGRAPVDLMRSLQDAAACAEVFRQPSSSIVLLSDFRAADWDVISDEALQGIRRRVESLSLPTSIALIQIDVQDVSNRSVHFAADQLTHARVGQPLDITVQVRNDAPNASGPMPVVAQVDGADIGKKQVSLSAGARAQVSFICRFDKAGVHELKVRIADDSPIRGDDEAAVTLHVLPALKCLIVDDSSASQLLERDSGFLQLALGAGAVADGPPGGPFEVTTVRSDQLVAEQLQAADIVVLTNVARLPDPVCEVLNARVADGAHLVLFPSDGLDREWYASTWGPGGPHALLPCNWGPLKRLTESDARVSVRPQTWDHPALSFFNREGNGQLDRLQIRQYVQLGPPDAAVLTRVAQRAADEVQAGNSLPIAWLSTGEPWLVTRSYGKGHVLQCSIACNGTWSNWPMRPAFVPLVQRLCSSPFDSDEVMGVGLARESELERLPSSRLERVASLLGATICASAEEYLAWQSQRSGGREIWQPLLWALIGLLFGEVLLQHYLSRGPR